MILSHKYKFIFIKTRKTGGTSLEIALSRFCSDDDCITQLGDAEEKLRLEAAYRSSQNYFIPFSKYSIVDWGRLLLKRKRARFKQHMSAREIRRCVGEHIWGSYYKFCVERNPWDRLISLYYWRTRNMNERPTFSEFLRSDLGTRNMSNYFLYTIHEQPVVDCIARYENLETEVARIGETLEFPEELRLPNAKRTQRTDRRHYQEVLTAEDRQVIERVCAKEIALLHYTFD
jgi:hypothetical protein